MQIIEIVGTCFAVCYVILAVFKKRQCWLAYVASAFLYTIVFYTAQLYTQVILQIFFIVLGLMGYRRWGKEDFEATDVSTLSIRFHLVGILATGTIATGLGLAVGRIAEAEYALIDSAITCFSIFTTWLFTKKVLISWIYWVAINAVAVNLYLWKELYPTAGLYLLFAIMSLVGYLKWRRTSS